MLLPLLERHAPVPRRLGGDEHRASVAAQVLTWHVRPAPLCRPRLCRPHFHAPPPSFSVLCTPEHSCSAGCAQGKSSAQVSAPPHAQRWLGTCTEHDGPLTPPPPPPPPASPMQAALQLESVVSQRRKALPRARRQLSLCARPEGECTLHHAQHPACVRWVGTTLNVRAWVKGENRRRHGEGAPDRVGHSAYSALQCIV